MQTREDIKSNVVNQLQWDNRVDANNIKVKIDDDNVAVLSGEVPTYSNKVTAGNIAWSVFGVNKITNNLEVKYPSAFTVPSDEAIKTSVEQRIKWNTDMGEYDLTVKVNSGVVTLEGSVDSYWKKTSAELEAEKATGVINVINKLAVVPTEKISDEIVGERIMDRIDRKILPEVDKVDVKVKDGKVTLTGTVDSWAAWRAAYDAAQFTSGVSEVNDLLTINYA